MGLLESVITWASPKTAYEREAWRQGLDNLRGYDAGDGRRLNAGWRVANESAEMTDRISRDTIRARTRDLEQNSDIMNSVTSAFRRNVIGKGYTLHPMTGDQELDKEVIKLWKRWCKKQNCDVTGTQSFNSMMRMAIQRKKIDGGIIFLKRYISGGLIPFKLQALEVDELDNTTIAAKTNGNKVVGGIEYNSFNKPVGYYIRQYSIDGLTITEPVYIDAKDVIFLYTKTRPSQIREMSDMSPTITRIRDTNEFMRAVSVKERILSCLAVFIKREYPGSGNGHGRGYSASNMETYNYQGKTIAPGMIQYLNPGDDALTVKPSGQATDATAYIKQELRLVGAGQGLSYETVSRDMSESNYSSARQGMIEDEMTYADDTELLLEVMDEIYETFVISLVLAEKIKIPAFWGNKDEYLDHNWIHAPKRWIDPLKEANANRIALATGQKTWADIVAENGRDWREQVDEIAEIMKYGVENGIDMGGIIFGSSGSDKTADTGEGTGSEKTDGNAGKPK